MKLSGPRSIQLDEARFLISNDSKVFFFIIANVVCFFMIVNVECVSYDC